jgi:hypothetical protein
MPTKFITIVQVSEIWFEYEIVDLFADGPCVKCRGITDCTIF